MQAARSLETMGVLKMKKSCVEKLVYNFEVL